MSQECISSCTCGRDGCCDVACEFDPDCPRRDCPDGDGAVDVGPLATNGDVDLLQAIWNGSQYALAYYDRPRGAFFAFADAAGDIVPGSIQQLSGGGLFTRMAVNGREHALVYIEENEALPDPFDDRVVVFERVDAAGIPIAGSRVELDAGTGVDERPTTPSVAYDPDRDEWLVVWGTLATNSVRAIRVSASGQVVPDSLVAVSPEGTFAYLGDGGGTGNVVSWVDGAYMIVWLEGGPGGVHLSRLEPELGVVADNVFRQGTQQPWGAAVTWSGDELAVVWYDIDPGADWFDVRFARATRAGVFIPGSVVSWGAAGRHAISASLSWDGREYAVGWWTQVDANTADIRVTHLRRSGVVTESVLLTQAERRPFFPFLAWDGCRTVIAYVDKAPISFDGRLLFLPRRPVIVE